MKNFIAFLFVILSFCGIVNASSRDTTVSFSLNDDGKRDVIKLMFDEDNLRVNLKINNSVFSYDAVSSGDTYINFVKSDGGKNLLMITTPDYYGYMSVIFAYNGRIDSLGELFSLELPEISGSTIKANHWMGFWSADVEYKITDKSVTLKYKDEYEMPEFLKEHTKTTTEKIFLHSSKMINAKGLYEVPKGVRIEFLKADIRNKCTDPDSWDDGCNWYLIRTSTGTEGWIMMKDFNDKIEGIPWAG